MPERVWTEAQFFELSWEGNHVHAFRFVETESGVGDLILDVDHIVESIKSPDDELQLQFRIIPVTLTFHGVMFLRMSLDYATHKLAFGPIQIANIERWVEYRDSHIARLWRIPTLWPNGELAFEARGFTQRSVREPILSPYQYLAPEDRSRGA